MRSLSAIAATLDGKPARQSSCCLGGLLFGPQP